MVINSLVKHWSYRIIAPGTLLREQYESLRTLLQYDVICHEQMADLQDILTSGKARDFARIRNDITEFSANVSGMVSALDAMVPGKYTALKNYHKKFDFYCRFLLAPPKTDFSPPYTLPLRSIIPSSDNVGNKAKQLARIQNELSLPVPAGFTVTTDSFHYLVHYNGLREQIDRELAELDITEASSLQHTSAKLQHFIEDMEVPADLVEEILSSHDKLFTGRKERRVAVRSNSNNEDGENSFAGQFTTILDVERPGLIDAYKKVLASKYAPEALYYRIRQGWGDEETAMSVLILEMIPAEFSGVIYTSDNSGDNSREPSLQIHAVRGLGEQLVSGSVVPEIYTVSRQQPQSLQETSAHPPLLPKHTITTLASHAMQLEQHFMQPLDIEWAAAPGEEPAILQARPLYRQKDDTPPSIPVPEAYTMIFEGGERGAGGVGSGRIYQIDNEQDLDHIPEGSVLLTRTTPPGYVRILNRVSAVVSEKGSRASHFATVAREFGIPFICAVPNPFDLLLPEKLVTVDGNSGRIYEGRVEELLNALPKIFVGEKYHRVLTEVLKFISPLELIDPAADNFTPEGCRSMHDIIRFCHEMALRSLFTTGRPGTGRGSQRLDADIPLDVYLFDVGGGIGTSAGQMSKVPLSEILSPPFHALWRGLSHPDVVWKQKPFDWDAYDKIELSGGVPPKKDSFAFASYAVIGAEYLHFNLRFGYHFTIVDVMCGPDSTVNHCMLRFAGGGGDFDQRSLRLNFLEAILKRLDFTVSTKGDLLEAKMLATDCKDMEQKLDILGRLLGATKLMDMVLEDEQMVADCVEDFFKGRYSFSQEG